MPSLSELFELLDEIVEGINQASEEVIERLKEKQK